MNLTKEQIEFLNKVVDGTWTLNSEGKVDVDGSVNMGGMKLTKIPVKFGRVYSFDCGDNNLTTLENAPEICDYRFDCWDNNLTTLDYIPKIINERVTFFGNNLTNYFKSIKEEDFKHWDILYWDDVIEEYPFLINISRKYVGENWFIDLIETYPKTKLYLK
jgi:hypothetical protein